MTKISKIILSISLIFYGLISVIKVISNPDLNTTLYLGAVFIINGLYNFYTNFSQNRYDIIFMSTSLYLTGVILVVTSLFFLSNTYALITPAILFIIGFSVLMIYINLKKDRTILYAALTLIGASVYSFWSGNLFLFYPFFDGFVLSLLGGWPLYLITIGIIVIVKKPK